MFHVTGERADHSPAPLSATTAGADTTLQNPSQTLRGAGPTRPVVRCQSSSTVVGDGTAVDKEESASGADAPMLAARVAFN